MGNGTTVGGSWGIPEIFVPDAAPVEERPEPWGTELTKGTSFAAGLTGVPDYALEIPGIEPWQEEAWRVQRQQALSPRLAAARAMEGQIAGRKEARDAAIRRARQAAARSMFGIAGGIGNLAGSGAVRSGLAQSGIDRALAEGTARAQAASEIGALEMQMAQLPPATEEALGQEAVAEVLPEMVATVDTHIGADDDAKMRAIEKIRTMMLQYPWPEVHTAGMQQIERLWQTIGE
jgi:hypothetical protein